MPEEYCIVLGTGAAGWKAGERSTQVAAAFGLKPVEERLPVLPLTGVFRAGNLSGMKDAVAEAAAGLSSCRFLIDGVSVRKADDGWTAGWRVVPGKDLIEWLSAVRSRMPPVMAENLMVPFARGLSWRQAVAVRAGLQFSPGPVDRVLLRVAGGSGPFHHRGPLLLPVDGLRLAIVQNGVAVAAFDLPGQEWLDGEGIADRERWRRTLEVWRGTHLHGIPAEAEDGHRVFVTSDLHLGHRNIIKYCARPFPAWETTEMDEALIANWNRTVRPGDRVFFLGDLTRNMAPAENQAYLRRLNGVIGCIRGNHDTGLKNAGNSQEITYGAVRFLLVHDPADAPADYDGWVIHGHTHNNDLRHYPFFDPVHRRINVSVEVTGFLPVNLGMLALMAAQNNGQSVLVYEPMRP